MSIGREDYAERWESRIERLENRASVAQAESNAAYESAHSIMEHIPAGQPILVGHHSERHHRRDLDRIDRNMRKSVEADKKAGYYAARAEAAASNTAISSDAPEAVEKLQAKLEGLQAGQTMMKAINAYIYIIIYIIIANGENFHNYRIGFCTNDFLFGNINTGNIFENSSFSNTNITSNPSKNKIPKNRKFYRSSTLQYINNGCQLYRDFSGGTRKLTHGELFHLRLRAYPEIRRVPNAPQVFRHIRRFFTGRLTPGKGNQTLYDEKDAVQAVCV